MKKLLFQTGLMAAVFALVVGVAQVNTVEASTNVYSFTARGVVTDFDNANGTVKIDITKVDGKGKTDLEGNNTEFIVSKATTVKVVGGKDKRLTFHNLAIGQELGIKGVKKDNDTYVVNFIRIEDRSFTVVGNLESYDKNAHTMSVLVVSSTYKPNSYNKSKSVKVNMVFSDDYSTFYNYNGKTAISFDDVNADAQKVKVWGTIVDSNTWKVTKLWDKYKGK